MYRKLVLGLVLCGILCGCEGPGGTLEESTEPTVITVQSGLVSFVEGTVTVDRDDIEGTWTDQQGETILAFDPRGVVTIQKIVNGEYTAEQVEWTIDENGLSVTDAEGGKLDYKVVEKDGQIQIMGSGSVFTSLEENESLLSQQVNFLGIGETAATDLVKLTMTGIEFSDAVSLAPAEYLMPHPEGTLKAQPGNLLACLSFRVQNLMDEGLAQGDFCNMTLEYDHSDRFGDGYYGRTDGTGCDMEAKSRAELRAAIECPELVGEENDVSLCISLTLPSSEGTVYFTYVLK